jgi:hypothetical protein
MVPDDAPDVGVQEPHAVFSPHVRVATAKAAQALPASQLLQTVAPAAKNVPAVQGVLVEPVWIY